MRLDFEYAIKKDVRNNPIVREIDEERQRQLWRIVGIGRAPGRGPAVLRLAALRAGPHGYQMSSIQRERATEEEVNRHLRLEIETLRVAETHRGDGDRAAEPGGPGARSGHRHRTGDARGTAGEVDRRGPLTAGQEATVAEQQAGSAGDATALQLAASQHGAAAAPAPSRAGARRARAS